MRRAAGVALAGVLLTLVALLFGAATLFIPGLAFTLLGLLTPLWVTTSARGARVRRRLRHDRVIEGEPVEATIEVRGGRWGLPGGEVLDPLAGAPVSLRRRLAPARGGAGAELRIVARVHRRGLLRLDAPSLLLGDALGLARVTREGDGGSQELLVLPRTDPVNWLGRGAGGRLDPAEARARAQLPTAAVDVDGLRPYRQGTPASRIHWPALARGAGLLERRLRADGDTRALIALDARCPGPSEQLDAAVRAAASLTLELARGGGCRLLLGGERRAATIEPDLAGWPGVHARLALVQGGPQARAPALGAGVPLGPLFYVAAGPLGRLPAPLAGAGGDWVLVLPAPLRPAAPASACFEVAGCHGYALGARSRWAGEWAA